MTDTPKPTNDALFDELLADKQALTREVRLADSPDISDELQRLRREAENAERATERQGDPATVKASKAATKELSEFEKTMKAKTYLFSSMGLGPRNRLKGQHALNQQQRRDHKARQPGEPVPEYNIETYAPALIAATCVGVVFSDGRRIDGITDEQALAMWEHPGFTDVDLGNLFGAAMAVDLEGSQVEEAGND